MTRGGGRLRVARIITRLNVGGPAIQAMLLTQRLDQSRYETMLVCGRPGPHEGDMLELRGESGVTPVFIPRLGRGISPFDDIRAFASLVRILHTFRPHIVHTHLAKAGVLGRLAARLTGAPVVIHTFHGNVLRGYFGGAQSGMFRLVERALALASTRIIAISPRVAVELRELGISAAPRLIEVPLGLDLDPFLDPPRGLLRKELGLTATTPLVGIVARLVPIKDVRLFLDAARIVATARPATRFVIVGDGELRDELGAQARDLGLEGAVRFLGWRADLPAIYADLDVLALTSRNEGTPVSVIEALASARAVVATAVGGVPDLIDRPERGLLVPPGDPAAVAAAIVGLLDDPERRARMGAAGRDAVFPEYDASTLVRRIDALYLGLAGSIKTSMVRNRS